MKAFMTLNAGKSFVKPWTVISVALSVIPLTELWTFPAVGVSLYVYHFILSYTVEFPGKWFINLLDFEQISVWVTAGNFDLYYTSFHIFISCH